MKRVSGTPTACTGLLSPGPRHQGLPMNPCTSHGNCGGVVHTQTISFLIGSNVVSTVLTSLIFLIFEVFMILCSQHQVPTVYFQPFITLFWCHSPVWPPLISAFIWKMIRASKFPGLGACGSPTVHRDGTHSKTCCEYYQYGHPNL